MRTNATKALLGGLTGMAIGIVIGIPIWFFVGLPLLGVLVIGIMVGMLAVWLAMRPPHQSKTAFVAVLVGVAAGIVITVWLNMTTPLNGIEILIFAVGGGSFVTVLANQIPLAYAQRQPTDDHLSVPVLEQYVADWKLDRIRSGLTVNRKKRELNECEIQIASNLHPMRLVTTEIMPVLALAVSLWAADDFEGIERFAAWLPTSYRPWMLIGLVLTGISGWLYFHWRELLKPMRLFVLVGLGFTWGYFGSPGWELILELFQEDTPRPWLILAGLSSWWIFWRLMKWYYGYMEVTDKRFVIGTVMPFPLPNYDRAIQLNKVATCYTDDSTIGNILGYGKLLLDGLGQRDWYFHQLRFVPQHKEYAAALNG